MQFNSYREAASAAPAASVKSAPLGLYVTCVEEGCYELTPFEDYEGQEFWILGNHIMPDFEDA